MKGKGKAPAVQPKQFWKPSVRTLDKHEGVLIETISLQDTLLARQCIHVVEKMKFCEKCFALTSFFVTENLKTFLFILNYFLIIFEQLSASDRNLYSKRPLRLWNYILLAPVHLLKHLVVNSLARRMEIQAPQRQNHSLQKAILWEQAFQSSTLRFSKKETCH